MNKILNWTFGACFRTLGRFLAIFIVGILLIFIGSKIGIELPSWLALNVKASINNGWASELQALSRADYKSCTSDTTCATALNVETDYITSPGYTDRAFILNSDLMTIGQNGYVIQSPVGTLKSGYLYNINYYLCHNKDFNSNQPFEIYASTYGSAINNKNTYNLTTRSALGQQPILDGGRTFDYCYLYSGLVVPDKNYTWTGYRIRSTSGNLSNVVISTIAVEVKELGIYTDTLKNLINDSGFASAESVEQVQESVNQVQQEIQQTQDTITNEDTTGAEDSASGFFNDFTTETFGLTAIITAPLNAINSLISSTCSPLVFPLPYVDKNISLPCMSSIYSEFFGGFFSIYQLITTGIISYYVIVRIFNLVKDFKNPDHDEIEVVDL